MTRRPGFFFLSASPTPVIVPRGPDPATNASISRRCPPDFLGRRLAVDLRVRGVPELTGNEGVRCLGGQLLGAADRPLHAFGPGSQHELGAQGLQEGARSRLIVSGMARIRR
jgi:hypothetical protein